ncbi:glucans biosynthesis glucosyltransferase MdoH [Lichenihabitans sp. Uapishka_5]|uniref:glucans biosynthesis glucosyltransferase MdoH n=1 Tax=Lichenihabitans sp. Uapishka_5 TaxID=3037302 RepID=UPI0029E7FB86|nr:glucans biosynthesis glucosyltransferase MdoH [Lichenihabitans sp. Uapishka_5]MDX7949727.1 glucans biosynthesis glucosyltransferase MdoH [Lichenihabitans sp. Uapishka_5]
MTPIGSTLDTRPAPLSLPELRRLNLRRLALVLPSLGLAATVLGLGGAVLAARPHGWVDWALLVPFSLAMGWECFIVWQLVLGFVQWLRGPAGRSPIENTADAVEPVATGRSRTALLVPIYEEDVAAVFLGVRVMLQSLARLGTCDDIELHVLSDTRDLAVAAAEEAATAAVRADFPGIGFAYRRRVSNAGRKAGNIADFLDRQGTGFDFAIVLDADSLMSGSAIRRLIRTMEESPRVGLLQTVSYAAGRGTLFARIQQFAVRLYAPLALRGLHFWQGPEGSYWGHNAIFRVAPFRAHCRLPVLPGQPPLGGEILCHDIVEGAMLARAGWEVHLLPDFEGTWEEMPTNTLDLLGRERRWCQGNLQHMRVLPWPGLKPASRAHLGLGIGGYLVVPVWWAFVLGGALRVLLVPAPEGYGLLAYGLTEGGAAATALLSLTLVLTILPRLLNVVCALARRSVRLGFGGARRLLIGAAVEQIFALLLNPVLSITTAGSVLAILAGRNAGWGRQVRSDRQITVLEAARHHGLQIGFGLLLCGAVAVGGGWYALWMAPTALGLCISPWLTVLSSRQDLGRASQRLGLFITQDDVHAAPELVALQEARALGA